MSEVLAVAIHPELKKIVFQKAEEAHLAINEYVAMILAEKFGRSDLAWIPRKRMGRPRKERAQT